ncbi:VWA domain-containing protein [Panacibacter ginsenosidivorans]|uniref:VWA domain-containing protein n=1 Tax=Panacibacter ginsenosidivorans TaxID=1813871 RepID=A0A5B8VE83_9BACT|nr:tyrosinase family protein [Panacibacter ginsenosidivorans]QEC69730.1 VWA domain-containing protein [Panacibacter ginsenosidivorans]
MALGDGIRRNIAHVDPSERALLIDAIKQLNQRYFPGSRNDPNPGGVSWWFKQDEIHQATHVHGGPEFIPWHREIVNRFEAMLREINPQLSLHYWDWTQDPRNIPNANLGGGTTGNLNLFTSSLMGSSNGSIGEPWLSAGYYVPGTSNDRDVTGNPADAPADVFRIVGGLGSGPESITNDNNNIVNGGDYPTMRLAMESAHNRAHGFVNMGGAHISFRDPFVFLLHSNVDRLFARWQTDPAHPGRLDPDQIYGAESNLDVPVLDHIQNVNHNIEPWSSGFSEDEFGVTHFTRPWSAPENEGIPHTYKHPSIIFPPCYDTNFNNIPIVEVKNAGTPPVINFNDIPSGDTAVRAASFKVYSCVGTTIRVQPGGNPAAPFSILQPLSGTVNVSHVLEPYVEARIWLAFTAGAANVAVPDGSVTFECVESGQTFTFILRANAIVRPRVAVMLALDQSGSMDDPAGTSGAHRIDVLKDAADAFMEVIPANSGVGLIRFDTDAYPVNDATFPGFPVTRITTNSQFDPNRIAAKNAVSAHHTNINGATSVGDGLQMARTVINAVPIADYEQKAIIVFTDGLENQPLSIADVAGSIDNRTFAIGLGNETQVNTGALKALTNGTGGYLLLSGILSSSIDDFFRLSKYFLQILAGVTNNNIVLDPNGYIAPGNKIKIPFQLNEADIDGTAILITDAPVVDMFIETPGGLWIDPVNAAGHGIDFAAGQKTKNYKFNLPVAAASGNHAGTWNVVLCVNDDDYKKYLSKIRETQKRSQSFATHGARYSVVVNTYSNLKMNVSIHQNSLEPGATLTLRAILTEYGLPVEKRSSVQVEIRRPDNTSFSLWLYEVEPGVFENSFTAGISGIYICRFLAKGVTLRGTPFTREQTLNGTVFNGGDKPDNPIPSTHNDCCSLIKCFLYDKGVQNYLKERKIDFKSILECNEKHSKRSRLFQ